MMINLFKGDKEVCGCTHYGGTDNVVTAIFTYRQWARKYKNITERPNIVAPMTFFTSIDKGCKVFNIELRLAPVNDKFEVDMGAVESLIDENTIALFCSAPDYSHGIFDPVQDFAKLGLKHNIGVHVDAGLGGFIYQFITKLKNKYKADFSTKGISSISVDYDKYGKCPKGCSVLLFRTNTLRECSYFLFHNWCGGIYATPGLPGSRTAAIIAGTWVKILLTGANHYRKVG